MGKGKRNRMKRKLVRLEQDSGHEGQPKEEADAAAPQKLEDVSSSDEADELDVEEIPDSEVPQVPFHVNFIGISEKSGICVETKRNKYQVSSCLFFVSYNWCTKMLTLI
jgi:hypothetical protein